jgi:L-amino acid N-acyltransferase YncA
MASRGDAAGIGGIYRPIVEATAISFEYDPPSDEELARRIDNTVPQYPWLVCEYGGVIAGYAYSGRIRPRAAYRWSVETSVYVHEEYRGRGIGGGLYQSLFAVLGAQGFVTAFAGIALPNDASIRLHERADFVAIGVYRNVGYKFGRWHDVGWWQRPIHPSKPGAPLEPVSVGSGDVDWQTLFAVGCQRIRGRGGAQDRSSAGR